MRSIYRALFASYALVSLIRCGRAATSQAVPGMSTMSASPVVLVGFEKERTVQPYNLKANAELSAIQVNASINGGGSPFWILYGTTPSKMHECVWVMLNDVSQIVSYQRVSRTGFKLQSVIEPSDVFPLWSPVHGSVSSDGLTVVAAYINEPPNNGCNSTGAGVASFKILPDCSLSLKDAIPHSGSSINKQMQCSAHPHSCTAGRDNFVFCCDRGADAIFTYKVKPNSKIAEVSRIYVQAGQGPRHAALHPTLPVLYIITELGSQVLLFKISKEGALSLMSNVSALPTNYPFRPGGADVVMSPDGEFLYASIRVFPPLLDSSIAVFRVSRDGLSLSKVQQFPVPSFPMDFTLATLAPNMNVLVVPSMTILDAIVPALSVPSTINTYLIGSDGKLSGPVASIDAPPLAVSVAVLPSTEDDSLIIM